MDPERLIGQKLEHYRILRQIGYGGMATVFLAEDTKLERQVAVKVFWPRPGETRDFLRRFAREARVLAQLNHPNILPVYDYGEMDKLANLDNLAYLVTPYMAGGTLRDMLKARKVLPPVEALRLAAPILNALQYAHERGLIHRDIKPGNMLFKDDGSLLLADFGLVKVTGAGGPMEMTDHTGTAITGTPEYMSPEQIEGRATQASDIYSVGIVLYEMLTGQRPFKADTAMGILVQQVHEQPRPMSEINPFLSPQLDSAVLRALEKDPAKRYASPANFLQALMQAASPGLSTGLEATSQTLPAVWPPPAQRPSQESPFMLPGNQPGILPGTYGQNLPGALGANLSLAPAAQTRPGPITDPGQLPREGASTPVTPARELPVYPSPNRINVAPPQGPSGPSAPP